MTYAVRMATHRDAPCLPDIERSAGRAFLALPDLAWIASDDVQSEALHIELIDTGAVWVVVDATDAPVGFLNGRRLGDAFHILEISVRSELQGQGLGRVLISEAANWARAEGFLTLTLTTFLDVPWNAPFYERLGFRTLTPDELTDALRGILETEAKNGLRGRCAMERRINESEK
jgi:GNAT superfamily N-acetyltransferase